MRVRGRLPKMQEKCEKKCARLRRAHFFLAFFLHLRGACRARAFFSHLFLHLRFWIFGAMTYFAGHEAVARGGHHKGGSTEMLLRLCVLPFLML